MSDQSVQESASWKDLVPIVISVFSLGVSALSFVVSLFNFLEARDKAGMDSALGIYRELNHTYGEFIRTCLQTPRLDCDDQPQVANMSESLGENEKFQQKILYNMLTNLFESAYVHFVKYRERNSREVNDLFDSQWVAWVDLIKEFLKRPAYVTVWFAVNDTYDVGFRCHMRYLIRNDKQLNEKLQSDEALRKPFAAWLKQVEDAAKRQKKKTLKCDMPA